MDKDRVVGSAKQVKGAVKESAGRSTLPSKGHADKVDGKIRNAIGRLRDKRNGK